MISVYLNFYLQHDHVFSIRDIDYIKMDGQHVIIIFQDKVEGGSLKDMIYQVWQTSSRSSRVDNHSCLVFLSCCIFLGETKHICDPLCRHIFLKSTG